MTENKPSSTGAKLMQFYALAQNPDEKLMHLHGVEEDILKAFGELSEKFDEVESAKNQAYKERDKLVCALSKVFPSWLSRHEESDKDWDDDWRWIVFVQLPTGQCSWHIHDSEYEMFQHLSEQPNAWDGHSTEEKYKRVDSLTIEALIKG